jgi:hypothetical protein
MTACVRHLLRARANPPYPLCALKTRQGQGVRVCGVCHMLAGKANPDLKSGQGRTDKPWTVPA